MCIFNLADDCEADDGGVVEGEEGNEDVAIQKYRNLIMDLKSSDQKKDDKDLDMEITWEPGMNVTKCILMQSNCVM